MYKYDVIALLIMVFGLTPVYAAGGPEFSYVEVDSYSSEGFVSISNLDQFEAVAQDKEVNTLFRHHKVGSMHEPETMILFFVRDGVIYGFDSSLYRTISDYRAGNESGFADGRAFYHAERIGVSDKQQYEYYADNWFLDYEDFLDAKEMGFVKPSNQTDYLPYPVELEHEDFEDTFLKLHVRRLIGEEYDIGTEHALFETLNARGMLTTVGSGRSTRTIIGTDLPHFKLEPAIELLAEYLRERIHDYDGSHMLGASYEYASAPYQLLDDTYRLVEHNRMRRLPVPLQMETVPDGVAYYFAKWNGKRDFQSYADLTEAASEGFESADDHSTARAGGFPSSATFYAALDAGFDTFEEFDDARALRIETYEVYRMKKKLESVRDDFGLSSFREAAVVTALNEIERDRTVSLQRIIDKANSLITEVSQLRSLERGFLPVDYEWFETFAQENEATVARTGTVNLSDSVFTGE